MPERDEHKSGTKSGGEPSKKKGQDDEAGATPDRKEGEGPQPMPRPPVDEEHRSGSTDAA